MAENREPTGPTFLSYQVVYVSADSARAVIERATRAIEAIEARNPRWAVVGFHLQEYDAIGAQETGNGHHVELMFDTCGELTKDICLQIEAELGAKS